MAEKAITGGETAAGLNNLAAAARLAGDSGDKRSLPPVHLWNPPYCGDIGMRIARDGTWFYQNSPIGRPALVKLFASVLRKDPEGHMLVTPVEKVAVAVEDAPFLAVECTESNGALAFRTNVDDWVNADADHPLRFERGPSEGVKPYVLVRGGLWALVTRPIFYDLVERGETRDIDGRAMFGVASAGAFFPMASAQEIENLV
ncbi:MULTISPECIES: DUF1285 domain-containing protein [unclassified Beijerinckia]|uniref:DUF1285 domain-containing protein n=1 Tax=unclassified Beijerinckia TaxID=2638183 RepID=UPI00089CB278|nr:MULTISPECIES: DUF1285 domain-containing protein [unclassified Beijerinckia]MDH7794198.1 hypothetical protein [Beijerinckia sp. GAS462]SEB55547.1 hypothetical protein SAMN05443249_0463 [Beijerinckia sp. 28-YEA-48]